MFKRLLAFLAVAFAPAVAAAQTAPAQMGITPTTLPEVLQVLDNTKTWVPLGNVDPNAHTFTPLGGDAAASLGWVNVTSPAVGMHSGLNPATSQPWDNSLQMQALVNAFNGGVWAWTTGGTVGGVVHVPPVPPQASAEYYFSNAFVWPRGGTLDCSGNSLGFYQNTTLVFAPGVDGVVEESWVNMPGGLSSVGGGFSGYFSVKGCSIQSLSWGTVNMTDGSNVTDAPVMQGIGAIPATKWEVGDGMFSALYTSSNFNHETGTNGPNGLTSLTSVPNGTMITAIDGSGNMTMSNIASFADNATNTPGQTMKQAIYRLPKELAYQISTEGVTTVNNAATSAWLASTSTTATAWVANVTSITVKNCAGFTPGRTVIDITQVPYVDTILLGVINNCTGTTLTFNAPVPFASVNTTSDTVSAVDVIPVIAGTCAGVWGQNTGAPATVVDTTFATPKTIGIVVTCDDVAHQLTLQTALASSGANDTLRFTNANFVVNGGPVDVTGAPVPWRPGDLAFSDAFPLGQTANQIITFSQGQALSYPYAVKTVGAAYQASLPATVAHPTGSPGSAWKVPAGLRRLMTSTHYNDVVQKFPIGLQSNTLTNAFGPGGADANATESFDSALTLGLNGIGEYSAGNNSGGSTHNASLFGKNFMADLVELSSVANHYSNVNMNSWENGTAPTSLFGRCDFVSDFRGGYITAQSSTTATNPTPYCAYADGSLSLPPAPYNPVNMIASGALLNVGPFMLPKGSGPPYDHTGIASNQLYGQQWKVFGPPVGYLQATGNSNPGDTLVKVNAQPWVYDGMQVWDITTPSAIPLTPKTTIFSHALNASITLASAIGGATGVKTGDVIAFTGVSPSAPCVGFGGGQNSLSGFYFDRDCSNQYGVYLHYMGHYGGGGGAGGLWGYAGAAAVGAPTMGFFHTPYQGYHGQNPGIVFPMGIELNSNPLATGAGLERLLDMGAAAATAVTSNWTAAGAFNTLNSMIPVTGATCPAQNYTLLDSTLNAANPSILGTIASCATAQPVLTLAANASAASLGKADPLTVGGAGGFNAVDWFGTGNILIPVNTCAGVSNGQAVVDTAVTGSPTIGTVNACGNMPTVQLPGGSKLNSSGAADALVASNRLSGDVRLDTTPASYAGWINTINGNSFRPFGLIANDAGGLTWPSASNKATIATLPACSATNSGSNAVVTNGLATPTYLQAVSATGTATRRVFCDGTGWFYD